VCAAETMLQMYVFWITVLIELCIKYLVYVTMKACSI